MNKLLSLLLLFIFVSIHYGQENYISVGGSFGLGQIKGRSPSITSFSGKLFVESQTGLLNNISFRFVFIYAQKFERIIPEDRTGKYYPFIKSYQFFAVLQQNINPKFFIKEGFGVITIQDRTFSDVNQYDYGIGFFTSPSIDLRNAELTGFALQASLDFGITFTGNTPLYYLISVGTEYYF